MSSAFSSEQLKAEAASLGFSALGIAKAAPVDEATALSYRQWIAAGGHGDMHYLAGNVDKRLDPTLLLPGARSIIVVAMNYAPARRLPDGEYQIADYALGRDYHDVMKNRLRQLGSTTCPSRLICVDTVPILERYWAWQAGLGFIGRNHQLIIPKAGSMFFLGEIITTVVFDHYDTPMPSRCGNCHRCIDACPTGALSPLPLGEAGGGLISNKCLSYQTIEHRGELDPNVKGMLGDTIYGCDRCQRVCPWNRFATPTDIAEFQPGNDLLNMTREQWHQLTLDDYRRLFRGSAVKRAKYEGLMRNIQAVRQASEADNQQ